MLPAADRNPWGRQSAASPFFHFIKGGYPMNFSANVTQGVDRAPNR